MESKSWPYDLDRTVRGYGFEGGDWHFQTWPDLRRGWRQLAVDVANTWTFYFPQRENVQATTNFCLSSSADNEATCPVCDGWETNHFLGIPLGCISHSHVYRSTLVLACSLRHVASSDFSHRKSRWLRKWSLN